MAEKMTLEQVRDFLNEEGSFRIKVRGQNQHDNSLLEMADAIDAKREQVTDEDVLRARDAHNSVVYRIGNDRKRAMRAALESFAASRSAASAPAVHIDVIDDALEVMELHGMHKESAYKALKDYHKAASAPAVSVPDGWVLVPREPTPEMLAAAQQTNGKKQLPRFSVIKTRWAAMVAAAPSADAQGGE